MERISTNDAYQFPLVASAGLFSLFIVFTFFKKCLRAQCLPSAASPQHARSPRRLLSFFVTLRAGGRLQVRHSAADDLLAGAGLWFRGLVPVRCRARAPARPRPRPRASSLLACPRRPPTLHRARMADG